MTQQLKFSILKIEVKRSVIEFIFSSFKNDGTFLIPKTIPNKLIEYFVWVHTFVSLFNTDGAPNFSKDLTEYKDTLIGKEIVIKLYLYNAYDYLPHGHNPGFFTNEWDEKLVEVLNETPFYKMETIYVPKFLGVKSTQNN